MDHILKLITEQKQQLLKALQHLEYSYLKLQKMEVNIDMDDDENLEIWESFSSRFSRVVDIFLAKFLRSYVLYNDPGFQGSLRDYINCAEKLSLVQSSQWWLGLRELRNITAHEYNDDDISQFYTRIYNECPKLLELEKTLKGLAL